MFWRVAHDTLRWLGISFFPALGFIFVAAFGLAQAFPEAKPWLIRQFGSVQEMMSHPAYLGLEPVREGVE
jgi:hypothetical protein